MTTKNQAGLIKIIDAVGCMEKCLSCAICLEVSLDPVETRCGHLFCRLCIQKVLSQPGGSCPICKFNLTRRSVSSSSHMGLCIQQLSKLVDAVQDDTGVDITSCLKTHYKKTFFLPSVYLSSPPQMQQDTHTVTSSLESDNTRNNLQNNIDQSAIPQQDQNLCSSKAVSENSFHQPREQANKSPRKLPTISKLQEISSKSVTVTCTPPSRVQNENISPPESTCNTDKSKFISKMNEIADQPFDENRQCLKEISGINENRSLSNLSTKTWSRVAKFGKELRRRSGTHSPRLHKKDKLCVNVRDKSAFSNSLTDNSTDQEKSGPDRVDHDLNASMRLENRDENDRNISDDKTNKTVDEKSADNANETEKQLHKENGNRSNALNDDVRKETTVEITPAVPDRINDVPNAGRRKVLRTKRTQYAECGQPENVVRFKKFGHLFKAQRKCVAFLYLGAMKPRRSDNNDGESLGICKLCWYSRRSDEFPFAEKRSPGSTIRLNRAKSFESSSPSLRNLPKNPKLLPVDEFYLNRTRDSDTRIEGNGEQNSSKKLSVLNEQIISIGKNPEIPSLATGKLLLASVEVVDKSLPVERTSLESSAINRKKKRSDPEDHEDQCSKSRSEKCVSHEMSSAENLEKSSPDQRESPESSSNRKKRKRSDPDHEDRFSKKRIENRTSPETSCTGDAERTLPDEKESSDSSSINGKRKRFNPDDKNECSKNPTVERASREKSCTEDSEFCRQDYLLNTTLQSRDSQLSEMTVHEISTTDVNETSGRESVVVDPVEIDFPSINAIPEANLSSRMNLSRKSSLLSRSVPKTVNSPKGRDPVGPEADTLSRPRPFAQNAWINERNAVNEMYGSESSMTDISREELLFKQFEENLFGRKVVENKPSEGNEKAGEDNEDNESRENEDFMELTPTNQNLIHTNNPPEIRRDGESATAQPSVRISENSAEKKSAETPLRSQISSDNNGDYLHTPAQKNAKIRPLYQSTPKSSQIPTDRCPASVYRQKEADAKCPAKNRGHSETAASLKPDALRSRRGCILCSGLTAKQCEDVKYLASLFNMQYTKKFSSDVTHVIVKTNNENNGACKTLKYLQAVAYRKWVLNFNWIVDCALQRKWLNEETYEVVDSSTLIAGPKKARIGESGPFENFVFFCVEPFQNISVPDYEDLLRQMGATVVGSLAELAAEESILKIIAVQAECHEKKIIEWHQITKAVPVAQEWIVECVSQYRLVSLLPFLQELVPQDVLDLGFPDELIQDDDSDFMYDASA